VIVVEPSKLIRDGIRAALTGRRIEILVETADGDEAIAAAAAHRPDAVVIDAELPDRRWSDVSAAILLEHDAPAIVVLGTAREEASVRAALAAGARAYLLKESVSLDLADAIDRVLAGETVIDPDVASAVVEVEDPPRLTAQELNVLRLVAEGRTNPEIGERLYLSRHTVKEYVSHAMRKLGASNRIEAVRRAAVFGLLEVPSGSARDTETPQRPTLVFNDSGRPKAASELKVQPLKIDDLRFDAKDPGDHSR
jgi:DNA-binding NarL/FixJ family response regulator